MATPVLELRNVTQIFRVKQGIMKRSLPLHAVSEVFMHIDKGEVLGLAGESGCGKSTLAKIFVGLLTPTEGEVRLNGVPIQSIPIAQRARDIQLIFQDPYSSLNPRKTVAQIVGLPLAIRGRYANARRTTVLKMLDLVGLPGRMENVYPNQMSGGQRQRVAIARALISQPKILICDEPTSALDVSVQAQILNLLTDLREELGLTYILISHNLAVIEHLADRVMVMYLGRIVEHGPTGQIFDAPAHPYSEALLRAVPPLMPGHGVPDLQLGADYPNPINIPPGCAFHPRCPKVRARCDKQRPLLTNLSANNMVACHLYDSDKNQSA